MGANGGGRGLQVQFLCWSGWSANGAAYRRGAAEEPGSVYWLAAQRCEVRHALQALGNPQPRAELIVQRQSVRIMERRDHSGTVVAGMIPQQRERVGEDASFVIRPQIAEASGSNIAVLAGKDATDWAPSFRSLATTSRYVSDKVVPGSSPAS